MAKYKITNIIYCIEDEDFDMKEEDFESREAYMDAIADATQEIVDSLPQELIADIGPESDGDLEDDLAEFISDETGWLVEGFNYEEVE